ncbi:unnamed protein product [Periconia digitata]|uniref:Uncharacterized protein n=1 Tax=Periconia digitata TaxID=1303443 RepID=A0A9W4U0Y3_9PLEO|nr:unnamed protein product [Periconia digitata]
MDSANNNRSLWDEEEFSGDVTTNWMNFDTLFPPNIFDTPIETTQQQAPHPAYPAPVPQPIGAPYFPTQMQQQIPTQDSSVQIRPQQQAGASNFPVQAQQQRRVGLMDNPTQSQQQQRRQKQQRRDHKNQSRASKSAVQTQQPVQQQPLGGAGNNSTRQKLPAGFEHSSTPMQQWQPLGSINDPIQMRMQMEMQQQQPTGLFYVPDQAQAQYPSGLLGNPMQMQQQIPVGFGFDPSQPQQPAVFTNSHFHKQQPAVALDNSTQAQSLAVPTGPFNPAQQKQNDIAGHMQNRGKRPARILMKNTGEHEDFPSKADAEEFAVQLVAEVFGIQLSRSSRR